MDKCSILFEQSWRLFTQEILAADEYTINVERKLSEPRITTTSRGEVFVDDLELVPEPLFVTSSLDYVFFPKQDTSEYDKQFVEGDFIHRGEPARYHKAALKNAFVDYYYDKRMGIPLSPTFIQDNLKGKNAEKGLAIIHRLWELSQCIYLCNSPHDTDKQLCAIAFINGHCMKIDAVGNTLGTLAYDASDGAHLGFVDKLSDNAIAYEVTEVFDHDDDFLTLRNEKNMCGLINSAGNLLVPFSYDFVSLSSAHSASVHMPEKSCDNPRCALYNYERGQVTDFKYSFIDWEWNGYRKAELSNGIQFQSAIISDIDGHEVVPLGYYDASLPSAHSAIIRKSKSKHPETEHSTDKESLYNYERGIVSKEYRGKILKEQYGRRIVHMKRTGKYGVIDDVDGHVILPMIYDSVINTDNPDVIDVQLRGKWGQRNAEGKTLHPCNHEECLNVKKNNIPF